MAGSAPPLRRGGNRHVVALCDDLPPHRGHPFIDRWHGESWQTVGMVWNDGAVELSDKLKPDKYDRLRRGAGKSGYIQSGYTICTMLRAGESPAVAADSTAFGQLYMWKMELVTAAQHNLCPDTIQGPP